MGALSAIALGASNNLLERAADVVIKEQGKLVLVVREMPLSAIHLEHMLKLARLGVSIVPPSPGFYFKPSKIEDLIDFVVARILDQINVPHNLSQRWAT
jgi:4-hydroxy-3-polyprenylbenzoate decarboxylase